VPSFTTRRRATLKRAADIIVVGGGPIGVCCALELARSGADVVLLEREAEVCPPVGGAYANCGLLVPSDATPLAAPGVLGQGLRWMLDASSPFYIAPRPSPALARWLWLFRAACSEKRARAAAPVLRALHTTSARLHDELAGEHGGRWHFHHDGELQVYETAAGLAAAAEEVEQARALGARAEEVTAAEARALFPSLCCELAGAFFFPEDGHLDPMRFTRAVAALAEQAGTTVVNGAEALVLRPTTNGVRTVTTRGAFDAAQIVLAAGAWTPHLTRGLGLRLPIEPAKGYSVDVERPADFPELPLYLGDAHVVITPLGDSLRLGSTLELSGWDMRVRPRRVAYLRERGRRAIGLPSDGPVRQLWRGPRPVTPDGLPVIGRVPGRDRVILASGHCMLGLSLGPVTGRLVAQLASGARPEIDLSPLAVQRFA
jgi:D-amino-acid dehydrogenase